MTRRNPLTFDPTCCGFSHSLFAIYARFYAAVNNEGGTVEVDVYGSLISAVDLEEAP